jgi:exodeoxyribonuclease V alpha subunit
LSKEYYSSVFSAESPDGAFRALDMFRILCVTRYGFFGVNEINAATENVLNVSMRSGFYHGRPILISANDYSNGLFNGDTGIIWNFNGVLRAVFRGEAGTFREVPCSSLPPHETAYAMTVHKSQGSEFEAVMLVVPPVPPGNLSRELLYTGLTRAREKIIIAGVPEILSRTVGLANRRETGLVERLKAML